MDSLTPTRRDYHRPRFHLTPASTWMNDPNGLIFYDGLWHAYFQNNPFGSQWGNLSWGHASSADLATWTALPVALSATDEEMIFSGSVVHDALNTSGFVDGPHGPLVAIFTSAYTDVHGTLPGIQAQSLAFSADGGTTWTPYPGNPVLDRGSADFRDPKVFRHPESDRWVMVAVEAVEQRVLVHTSADLINWEYESDFTCPALSEGIWECPDLLRVPVDGGGEAWVLVLSTNPAGVAGGSGTFGVLGSFDGHAFAPESDPIPLDYGHDAYATVSFSGVEGAPVLMGWMNNWAYATTTPTDPWRSSMTLPRTMHAYRTEDGPLELRQRLIFPSAVPATPVLLPEDDSVPETEVARFRDGSPFRLRGVLPTDRPVRLLMRFGDGDEAREVSLEVSESGSIAVDRSQAHALPFASEFARSAPLSARGDAQAVAFDLLVDGSCLEVELDDGRALISEQIFPDGGEVSVSLWFPH